MTPAAVDAASVLVEGPWEHRFVAANGSRFHVAVAGSGPLVVLLHGFPTTWWTWRHQLPALAEAGYRAAAVDLRGSGASDKPPQGYDVPTLTRDVAGIIRSLGASDAVVVGHGVGGAVAWSMPALRPDQTRAVAALASAHPARLHGWTAARLPLRRTAGRIAQFQLPWLPERRLTRGDLVTRVLSEWGAPGWPDPDTAATYRAAMRIPFAAHCAMEMMRWRVRSTPRVDGQRFLAALRAPVEVPVLQLHGDLDGCLPSSAARATDVGPDVRFATVAGAGHFLSEEAPEQVNAMLLEWLDSL